jgi:hypothetical protein
MRNFAIGMPVPVVPSSCFESVDVDQLVDKLVDPLKKDCILFCSAGKSSYFGQSATIA